MYPSHNPLSACLNICLVVTVQLGTAERGSVVEVFIVYLTLRYNGTNFVFNKTYKGFVYSELTRELSFVSANFSVKKVEFKKS